MYNSILFNPSSLFIQNNLSNSQSLIAKNMQRMSSGLKINQAKDDSSGCVLSARLSSKLSSLNAVQKNSQQATSLLTLAEDSLKEMENIALRIRDLSLQSMNDTTSIEERNAIQDEINELNKELYRIKNTTQMNGFAIFGDKEEAPAAPIISPIATASTFSLRNTVPENETETISQEATTFALTRSAEPATINATSSTSEKIGVVGEIGYKNVNKLSKEEAIAQGYTVIETAQDFANLSSINSKIILMNDIDLTGIVNTQKNIGTNGILNGNGYKITGYESDKAIINNNQGTIKNLVIENAKVENCTGDYGAILANKNYSIIENCKISGNIDGNTNYLGMFAALQTSNGQATNITISGMVNNSHASGQTGGLIGNLDGKVANCKNINGDISGESSVGGLIGYVTKNGEITNSSSAANLKNGTNTGGLTGYCNGKISNSESSGTIQGNKNVGGLTGCFFTASGLIKNSKTNATIICNTEEGRAGGFVGYSSTSATVSNCYSSGNVTNDGKFTGGFAGSGHETIFINCLTTGNVYSTSTKNDTHAGGFIGETYGGYIENSSATGDVKAKNATASGFCTLSGNTVNIKNSYSTSNVTSNTHASGFINTTKFDSILENCFASGTIEGGMSADSFSNTTGITIINCYSNSNQSGNVTNKNNVEAKEPSWFQNAQNLTFLGDEYDYRFNPPKLKNLSDTSTRLQIGEEDGISHTISIDLEFELGDFEAKALTRESAQETLQNADKIIDTLTKKRSKIGATLNRIESICNLQNVNIENLSYAKSLITDTDMAQESMSMVKNNILNQVSTALFTQANTQNSGLVMSLLSFNK